MNTKLLYGFLFLSCLLVTTGGYAYRSYPPQAVHQRVSTLEDSLTTVQSERDLAQTRLAAFSTIMERADRHGISNELSRKIYQAARLHKVPVPIAYRLIARESGFNPEAVSSVGAIGLTQVRPSTARTIEPSVKPRELFRPRTNLRIGFQYLHRMWERFDRDWYRALSSYHQGPTRYARTEQRGSRNISHEYATEIMTEF